MNDQNAAQQVTRSLSTLLSADEQAQLDAYLAASPQTREFARLSAEIQAVLSDVTQQQPEPGPGLSQLAKLRLARILQAELAQSDQNLNRQVAEDGQAYKTEDEQP